MTPRIRALKILEILKKYYPGFKISLNYLNNFELLIAVMLSAQTTDKAVNKVTFDLFKKYRRVTEFEEIKNFANANIKTLEKDLNSLGLFRTKARNIKKTADLLIKDYNGTVPKTMDELLTLPGVGRKTANVVLSHAYNKISGIAVDTHVKRLSFELGLTEQKDPNKIEKDLMKLFDKKDWKNLTHLLISHGREKDKTVEKLLRKFKV